MAFSKLSGDEQGVIFSLLCNTFDPGLAVAFSSASSELRALTNEPRQRLRAGHEAAAAFCHKVGMRSCKALREARNVIWVGKNLSSADLATLGNLDLVLPTLERLVLYESPPGPEGMERLFEKLGTGALPALTSLNLDGLPLGDTGASALAAALGRGALQALRSLQLTDAAIGDAGMTSLAPALRRQPALENLSLLYNPLGDKGLAALVAPTTILQPSRPASRALAKLTKVFLGRTSITDAGCVTLTSALATGALPALEELNLLGIPASAVAIRAVVLYVMALAQRSRYGNAITPPDIRKRALTWP